MKVKGSAAWWMGITLVCAISGGLLNGCGRGDGSQSLVTIDAEDFQEPTEDAKEPTKLEPVNAALTTQETADSSTDPVTEKTAKETPGAEETPKVVADSEPKPIDPQDADVVAEDKKLREVKVLIPDRKLQPEGPNKAIRITYDDINLLKVLNMDPVTVDAKQLMPSWLRDLEGKRIRLRGFMYPSFQETGLSNFVIVRDIQECCFGPNPKPYDLIPVLMRKGATTDYLQSRPFDVEGVFHIKLVQFEGDEKVSEVYWIDDALVIQR